MAKKEVDSVKWQKPQGWSPGRPYSISHRFPVLVDNQTESQTRKQLERRVSIREERIEGKKTLVIRSTQSNLPQSVKDIIARAKELGQPVVLNGVRLARRKNPL